MHSLSKAMCATRKPPPTRRRSDYSSLPPSRRRGLQCRHHGPQFRHRWLLQFLNNTNDIVGMRSCRVCRMLHQIFPNDFNGCQRVSAAPCNMYATYGAGFSTVHNLGRTFGILRGESCVSQTAHLNSIPSSTISRSADSLLKRCGWERVGQLPLPGVQVGGFSRRLYRQVQKETMSL